MHERKLFVVEGTVVPRLGTSSVRRYASIFTDKGEDFRLDPIPDEALEPAVLKVKSHLRILKGGRTMKSQGDK